MMFAHALPLVLATLVPQEAERRPEVAPDVALVIQDVRDLGKALGSGDVDAGVEELAVRLREAVGEGPQVAVAGSALTVGGTPAELARVRDHLTMLRDESTRPVTLQVEMLEVSSAARRERLPDVRVIEGTAAADAALAAILAGAAHDRLMSPRIMVLPLQQASISAQQTFRYVRGYDVLEEVHPGPGRMVVPDVAEEQEGRSIECRVIPVGGGAFDVECTYATREVRRPVDVEETEHGTVAVPEVEETKVSFEAVLKPGATLLTPIAPSASEAAGGVETILVVRMEERSGA